MKASHGIHLVILLFYTFSCVNKNHDDAEKDPASYDSTIAVHDLPDSFQPGKIISPVYCQNEASQSYALYIPAKGNGEPLPVMYFFDPHGDGSFPLSKYKALADAYGFILVGSNNSKNGNQWQTTENTWQALFHDSQKRLKIINNRIYACGFSGGAKVAGYVALNHPEVKGVIANGAGLPDATPAGNFNFSFSAVTGEGDMNMTDLVAVTHELDNTNTRHRIIYFNGKHEWAPESTMNIAFAGLQLDAMKDRAIPVDQEFIGRISAAARERITGDLSAGNFIRGKQECELLMNLLDGLSADANWFREKNGTIQNDPTYQEQLVAQQKQLVTEQNLKASYSGHFQGGGMDYWIKTISELQTKARGSAADAGMYQRLLAYLSLAFYSISNQLINGNQDSEATHFVNLYKLADATNSEAWYFSAILHARDNNGKATEEDLLKAISCGFTDKNRLMQQPEFRKPQVQDYLPEVKQKMDAK